MQFKYNDEFSDIIFDCDYYKLIDELPKDLMNFIYSKLDKLYFFDFIEEHYYCSKCRCVLDENYKCSKCDKVYKLDELFQIWVDEISNSNSESFEFYFYYFDFSNVNVLLYLIEAKVSYESFDRNVDMNIKHIYGFTENGVYDIKSSVYSVYEEVNKKGIDGFLYLDNLEKLKYCELYKYSDIWELKEFFETILVNLSILAYYPICFRQFEYLVKLGFYKLACECPFSFNGKSFKSNFGVDKKYYSFMKSINISERELSILKLNPTTDRSFIDYYKDYSNVVNDIVKYVDLAQLKDYLSMQGLDSNAILEYRDYLRFLDKLGFDLKDRSLLFPKDLMTEHDRLELENIITTSPDKERKLQCLAEILKVNFYDDGEFIIYPVCSIFELLDESRQMHNCVRTYLDMICENECQIYFMRYKDKPNVSFVTIEVRNNKVVQARCKYNQLPDAQISKIISKWEEGLLEVF